MKPTLIQTNEDVNTSLKDDLFGLFMRELDQRGSNYIDIITNFTTVSQGKISSTIIEVFIRRLALNPSLVSIFAQEKPLLVIEALIRGEFNDLEVSFINDFLDDTCLSVRMKNDDLYQQRLEVLKDQIIASLVNQNDMDSVKIDAVRDYLKASEHNLLALYYYRKIGYIHGFPKTNTSKE